MPQHETFEQQDYSEKRPFDGEFFECTFEQCDFTSSDLAGVTFVDCTFVGCNLSMANIDGARLQGVSFENCKLLGVDFGECSGFAFAVGFEACNLNFASFWQKKMAKTRFEECSLREVNFVEADLREAVFSDCELNLATFERTVLEQADFRSARDFRIDPDQNRVSGAKFSKSGLEGLLLKYNLDVE